MAPAAQDWVEAYTPDVSLKGKLRRRLVRLVGRRPARRGPGRPMVSFTFDDAPASAALAGAQLLEARGLRGSYYIAAGLAGREGPMGRFATREQTLALQAAGHEIACHTFSHLDCGPGGRERIGEDVERNRATLTEWGLPEPSNFAFPFGDVSADAKAALGRRFQTLRGLHHGVVAAGTDLNQAPAVGIEGPDGEAVAKRWMDEAQAKKAWLILYTHDVAEAPSEFGCTPDVLGRLIDKAVADGFDVVTVAEGAARVA